MNKRMVKLFVLMALLAALFLSVQVAGASLVGEFAGAERPAPHAPLCEIFTGREGEYIVRCIDLGGDICDIFMLSPSPDIIRTKIKIDGDVSELRVYLPPTKREVSFAWFVCDEQGNVTSGRYPA